MRSPHALAVAALGAAACAAPSPGNTLASAVARVHRVRPEADLGGVRAEVWESTEQAEAARALSDEPLSYPYAREILRAQRPLLDLLGLSRSDYDPLEPLIGEDSPMVAAFVIPAHGLVLIRDPGDVRTMAHELGHIASWRMGYWERSRPHLWLDPGRAGDPAWVDLDAYIASWALAEGCAELTELAASGPEHDGNPAWSRIEDQLELTWHGIDRRVKGPLVVRLQFLAYQDGARFVLARRGSERGLEDAIERAWDSFRWTTREIGFPAASVQGSRLAPALRAALPRVYPPPAAATRIGAFLLFQCLSNRNGFEVEPFDGIAAALEDDLLFTWEADRHLWLTLWRDDASAEAFAAAFADVSATDTITVRGNEVIVDWSSPATDVLTVLREELAKGEARSASPGGG